MSNVNEVIERDNSKAQLVTYSDLLNGIEDTSIEDKESRDYPPYVNITFHRSQLVLLKYWLGSMDRDSSVEHLAGEDRNMVMNSVQDIYEGICNALEKYVPRIEKYPALTEEEEKLLAECFEG